MESKSISIRYQKMQILRFVVGVNISEAKEPQRTIEEAAAESDERAEQVDLRTEQNWCVQ
jgi:hypothetical protein